MTGRLAGKKSFVTAAGTGIGRAITFAAEGAQVIATNRTGSRLKGLEEDDVHELNELDVTNAEAVKAIADKIGIVDILVYCAGTLQNNTILTCSKQDLGVSIDINLKGTINAIQAFLPQMLGAAGVSIVNIGSIISSLKGVPNRFAYGTTETESMAERIESAPDAEEARAMYSARHPMGRSIETTGHCRP